MRDHLGRGRIDAGGDRNTLFRDVVPEPLDLPISICELARHRSVTSSYPRQPGLLLGGPFLYGRLLRRPSRFLSSHRPPPCFGLTPAAAPIPWRRFVVRWPPMTNNL